MLTVYLDSSDYSVMSDPDNLPAQEIRTRLEKYSARGIARFPFSAIHMIECAHLDVASRPMALRRATLIHNFAEERCFPWWLDTAFLECTDRAKAVDLTPIDFDSGSSWRWLPDMSALADSFKKAMIDGLKEMLVEQNLPRQQRRQMFSRTFRRGKVSPLVIAFLRRNRSELLKALEKQFPLTTRFYEEDLILRFAAGEVSSKTIAAEFEKGMSDPINFVGWIYDRHDKDRKMTGWLRKHGGRLVELVEDVRRQFIELQSLPGAKLQRAYISRQLENMLEQKRREVRQRLLMTIFHENEQQLKRNRIYKTSWISNVIDSQFGAIPSLDSYIEALINYFRNSVVASKHPQKLKRSDAGDIFHMCYMARADIFRCDVATSRIATKVAKHYGVKVINKLSMLPEAIEDIAQYSRPH